ncbi:hypothetical protein [Arthrobacter sp. 4R501]|uniref:hypothetical protein n=1 Tax=Arthrobacter sp. 4R501 TaxID=2058886 RepID=UPI000CE5370B|nr:hypothetical protein [Arthrobacter sp. 4R501]
MKINGYNALGFALSGIEKDQDFMRRLFGTSFKKRSSIRAWLTNPSIRAAFLMRLSSWGGVIGIIARQRLISNFSCDVTPGAQIRGALYLPHPVGIVIGSGTNLVGSISIYQGVTIGSNKNGSYPTVHEGVRIFPNALVIGNVTLHADSTVGAGAFVSRDVAERGLARNSET